MSQNKKLITLSLAMFVALTAGVFMWTATTTSGTTDSAEFKQEIRNAISEANLAKNNDTTAIYATPDNLANFIYNRSGIQFSQTNKDSLRLIEQQAWNQSKRITQGGLANALTQVSFERLVNLSDTDIDNMAVTLTGFDAPGLSNFYQGSRDTVVLRFTGEGRMTKTAFKNQVQFARDNAVACQSIALCSSEEMFQYEMTRAALRNRIANEISIRMNSLGRADENFSGGNIDDMTPAEAMLISYSVVTNDLIAGSQSELLQKMSALQQTRSQLANKSFVSPQGYRAFGTNGYLHSSPATLLLDDATTARILTLIKQEGNIQ